MRLRFDLIRIIKKFSIKVLTGLLKTDSQHNIATASSLVRDFIFYDVARDCS